jgi:hypothetical protein
VLRYPIPYTASDGDNEEMTMVSLCQDPNGKFTGALMPMATPMDSVSQWQSLIDGLISCSKVIDPEADLDGLYVFSWWSDVKQPEHSGMLFTRLCDEPFTSDYPALSLPHGTMGILSLSTDKSTKQSAAITAISGYVSAVTNNLRDDQILCATVESDGEITSPHIEHSRRKSMSVIGELMNRRLDMHLTMSRA